MNILIDTHIFLWLANGNIDMIKAKHLVYIKDINNNIFISSLSIAEISIKVSINKLKLNADLSAVLRDMNIKVLDFDIKSALKLAILPLYHRDPFDRMIIVQAVSNKYKLISYDKHFIEYDCELL